MELQRDRKYKAVVIGGSAGSFPVIVKILSGIPNVLNYPLILCLHRLKHVRNGFVEALNSKSKITVMEPLDKQPIKPGCAYLAPANYHLGVEFGNIFSLSTEPMVKFSRPSIDVSFDSLSYLYKDKLVGIILSGANTDGANGISILKKRGGLTIVQNPEEATIKTMPEAATKSTEIDHIFNTNEIINFLNDINKLYEKNTK